MLLHVFLNRERLLKSHHVQADTPAIQQSTQSERSLRPDEQLLDQGKCELRKNVQYWKHANDAPQRSRTGQPETKTEHKVTGFEHVSTQLMLILVVGNLVD